MSFHSGQTFTFGETPSATKWNYLWENDYALADGTGISDDAIIARHVSGFDRSNLTTDSNPYKFSAYKSGSNQSTTGGVAAKISFQTERFDTNGNYDNATNYRYTIPVAGFYFVNSIIQTLLGSSSTDNNIQLYKNGSLLRKGGNLKNGAYPQHQVVGLFQFAASDYIEIYFINVTSNDSLEQAATSSTFEAILMCRT